MVFSTNKIKIGQNRSISDPVIQKIQNALTNLCLNLAKQIVVDGEGAKKFITIKISGAKSLISAKKIAFSIANSPLIKTGDTNLSLSKIPVFSLNKCIKPLFQL